PEERERLPIEPTKQDRDEPVDEKHTENPGRQFGFAQTSLRADRQDDRHGGGRREHPADKAIGRIDSAEVGAHLPPARWGAARSFEMRKHFALPSTGALVNRRRGRYRDSSIGK